MCTLARTYTLYTVPTLSKPFQDASGKPWHSFHEKLIHTSSSDANQVPGCAKAPHCADAIDCTYLPSPHTLQASAASTRIQRIPMQIPRWQMEANKAIYSARCHADAAAACWSKPGGNIAYVEPPVSQARRIKTCPPVWKEETHQQIKEL